MHSKCNKKRKLLTKPTSNPKTKKSKRRRYANYILHLAAANESGYEVCRNRTPGCTTLCINREGRAGILKPGETTNAIQEARKARTRFLFENQEEFLAQLVHEVELAIANARRRRLIPCFRLNGTSDIWWEFIPVIRDGRLYSNLFEAFPRIQFYDYTKANYAARRHDIRNYDLTFSYAETIANRIQATIWWQAGYNVAVPFALRKSQALPAFFDGKPVYDADMDDLRFLDPRRHIAGLHAKGNRWKHSPNAFMVQVA